jgi:hypothetical protein
VRILAALVVAAAAGAAAAQQVNLTIDDLEAPGFAAKTLKASLSGTGRPELLIEAGSITIGGRNWRNVRLHCPQLRLDAAQLECVEGTVDAGGEVPLSFSYSWRTRALAVALKPEAQETWRLNARFAKPTPEFNVVIDKGRIARVAAWLPPALPGASAGTLSGTIAFTGPGSLTANFAVDGLAFSEADGLHAGEKIRAGFSLRAEQRADQWQWQATAEWNAGEVFWQPLYLTGANQRLNAAGVYDAEQVRVQRGVLEMPEIGNLEFQAAWARRSAELAQGMVSAARLRAAALYAQILKPFLEHTAFGDLRAEGDIGFALRLEQGAVQGFDLTLAGVSLEDRNRRFALFGADGVIPWQRDAATTAELSVKGGELLQLPFGAFRVPLRMRGMRFAAGRVEIPVLDGKLTINEFATGEAREGWRWRFSGGIAPISMAQFTQSVGLPTMHGSLSAVIPQVIYRESTLTVDGALLFKVFDGTVVAKDLKFLDPFGKVPRLHGDVEMRNLDLDLLTRTFSFGNITGRIDAQVVGLELADWRPVSFDARIASSAGDYPRRISQRAVQNISALGGAGAAAAIQRSFLRFFEQFGYEKLGLSCKLRNNVCEMDGVESAPQGYVIVKGGGIPAISVIGYNRQVSWQELLDRLKRITQDNVQAIVK